MLCQTLKVDIFCNADLYLIKFIRSLKATISAKTIKHRVTLRHAAGNSVRVCPARSSFEARR